MDSDTWRSLLYFESRDFVCDLFFRIHGRSLNARRAREIISSARQGREYFRSASQASLSVRPLLSFYGVASLCRSLTLLYRRNTGEDGLNQGHGLLTVAWPQHLRGELVDALPAINGLTVRACKGLFSDLGDAVANRTVFDIYGKSVSIPFKQRGGSIDCEVTFGDILDRLPDIARPFSGRSAHYVQCRNLSCAPGEGLTIIVKSPVDHPVCEEYSSAGYVVEAHDEPYDSDTFTSLRAGPDILQEKFPQIVDARVMRTLAGYPVPHLTSKFHQNIFLPQISIIYILSFILGMLVRYFPTHWTALMGGEKGDAIWPSINAVQSYVEQALPELVLESINNNFHVDNVDENEKTDAACDVLPS